MNIPGIFKIEYYPAGNINFPLIKSNQTIDITDYTAETATQIEFIPESATLSAPKKEHAAGDYFEVAVSFDIAGNDTTVPEKLSRGKYIYRLTDKTGTKWLIGLNNYPSLSYSLKNDKDGSGGRSIRVTINWPTSVFPVILA